ARFGRDLPAAGAARRVRGGGSGRLRGGARRRAPKGGSLRAGLRSPRSLSSHSGGARGGRSSAGPGNGFSRSALGVAERTKEVGRRTSNRTPMTYVLPPMSSSRAD